ncbi:MAG: RNA polymerase sigma factor [Bacteroidales bacterium]|jgi:RNA polymerase sigma factor (sigma-70 family)|nr:RNA polymerase sigma factor [Bacteroidales bacterium]
MEKALETELAQIRPKVLAMARRFFRAARLEGDPEDVVQDVLLRLWVARRDGATIRSAEAWAVATAKNCCISLWRKKGPVRSGVFPEWLPDGDEASAKIELTEAESLAQKALEQIPEGTRRLLQLKATGLSLDEIAALTGRSKGSVKSSISTARKEMMKSLNLK